MELMNNKSNYEYGLYGTVQYPKIILEKVQKEYPNKDFIFVRIDESPYHQEFALMMKDKENNI